MSNDKTVDKNLQKEEERRLHEEQKAHEYSVAGKGVEVGQMVRSHDQSVVDENSSNSKKKREEDQILKLLLDAAKDFDDLIADIQDKINDFNKVVDRQNRRNDAFQNQDWEQYRLILINDYDMNPNDVNAMSVDDLKAINSDLDDTDNFTKATLAQEINDLVKGYDDKYGLTDEQKQKLEELFEKSKDNGIDFHREFAKTNAANNIGFKDQANEVIHVHERLEMGVSPTSITDPFNQVATVKPANPFDLENENKSAPNPFADAPSNSPNPFG